MIPRSLGDWTIERIGELANQGYYETDAFDFKEMLPDSRDAAEKERLTKTCAAFANSAGGFLIFGVKNEKTIEVDARVVGLDATLDFPERFGNYPALCYPSVEWAFRNPSLMLPTGRVVHVVHIPRSSKAPHACGGPDVWVFPKRTNKGNESMSFSEVQSMFLGYYEKRIKLQLLRAELEEIGAEARRMIILPENDDGLEFSPMTIELRVLETVLADTYSITQSSPVFLGLLNSIRTMTRRVGGMIETLRQRLQAEPQFAQALIKDHNSASRNTLTRLWQTTQQVVQELDSKFLTD